jgi:ribosomal protein S19E (S16A)
MDPDWYFVRAASIARKIYLNGGIGVGALSRWYGGQHNSSNKPEKFRRAARGLIRHILKNLEKAGLVEAVEKGCVRVEAATGDGGAARGQERRGVPPPLHAPHPPPLPLSPPPPPRSGRKISSQGQKELDTVARNAGSA